MSSLWGHRTVTSPLGAGSRILNSYAEAQPLHADYFIFLSCATAYRIPIVEHCAPN